MKNQINVQHIKNYFSQKIVLILGIVLLIPVITSFVSSILAVNSSTDFIKDIYSILNATGNLGSEDAEVFRIMKNFIPSYGITMTVLQFIFSLVVPSVWLFIYFRSKSPDPNKTPSGGLMFFFVIYIISIVSAAFIILSAIIFGVLGFILTAGSSTMTGTDYDNAVVMSVVFIVLSVVFILVGTFTLILSISGMKFFGATRKSMTSPNMIVSGKVYGVLLAIISVFAVISGLSLIIMGCIIPSIIDGIGLDFGEALIINSLVRRLVLPIILSGIATILSAIPYILESKIALGYCRMAKSVPPAPTPNQYNPHNSYNQNNQYNPYNQVPPQG
ncbi:MAG: hypothetical protein ACI4HZ_03325 [Ruminococcus sp.]